jgi:hypothetical protein
MLGTARLLHLRGNGAVGEELCISEARSCVVVDDPDSLQMAVNDGRTHKLEAATLEVGRHAVRQGVAGAELLLMRRVD